MTAGVTKIAIIGGGVAGLYCAYRLLDRDYEVTLYEATSRLAEEFLPESLNLISSR